MATDSEHHLARRAVSVIIRVDEMSKCFLDIDIGDPGAYASELAAYERACKFLKTNGRGYGLEGDRAADLNDAGKELLLEVTRSAIL